MTYRHGVKELAYSRALPLIERLVLAGAKVLAYDPLLTDEEIARTGATPWTWGQPAPEVRAIVTQTADPLWGALDPAWFPNLAMIYDGRNSLADLAATLPPSIGFQGVGTAGRPGGVPVP